MHLTPHEQERLLIHVAADVAGKRRDRGLLLNYPETMALLTVHVFEAARDGKTVSDVMDSGRRVLTRDDVMDGVPEMIKNVQVEATFPDGTKLVTIHDPIPEATQEPEVYPGKVEHPQPARRPQCPVDRDDTDPSACCDECEDAASWHEAIAFNENLQRDKKTIKVRNTADRPIQVGSHYHFAEVNPGLMVVENPVGTSVTNEPLKDCAEAKGRRLNIAAGTSVRFEPGDVCCVELVKIDGDAKSDTSKIQGLREGDRPMSGQPGQTCQQRQSNLLKRADYAALYGPTTKDRVRLADTDLTVEIEADWSGGPKCSGNEMIFGGGKVIRESMGMSHIPRDGEGNEGRLPMDTVITGALILDWWGVVKADVGIRDGKVHAIGKAYNPETMDPISEFEQSAREQAGERLPVTATNFVVGPSTEVISGNGRMLTAGGVDTHVHFICPEEIHEALASGVTTLIGGGTGPAEGSTATTVTPGEWHITRVFEALDEYPVNIGLLGKGSTMNVKALNEQVDAGVIGFKVHEDWGATPAVIDKALAVCEERKVQLALHADSLNESGFLESTKAAFKDRSIHIFHVEGAGGGHAPDMIELVKEPNVLPASTNPTRPLTVNTVKEHVDMMVVCHHLNPDIPADMAFADSRIRPSTMAAEDLLHDMGAISMMSSDAQAMGRIGEMIMRTWQTAHVMKSRYGALPEDLQSAKVRTISQDTDHSFNEDRLMPNDNYRARRYVAKYTVNPSITHGIAGHVGSVEPGRLADLVLWEPKFFGVKTHMVLKGGQLAYAQVGDANASITTPQPYLPRAVWGATGRAPGSNSVNFAAPGVADRLNTRFVITQDSSNKVTEVKTEGLGLSKTFVEISDTRGVKKTDMKLNDTVPDSLEVDHNSFEVTIGGATTSDARTELNGATVPRSYVTEVPLAQRYFLF